jgi:hypothetical protein
MRYHKYLRNFIDQHPKRSIPSSILFYSKKTGGILNEDALCQIYTKKLKPYFVKLLDTAIGQDDRSKIFHLLKKPWNPNVLDIPQQQSTPDIWGCEAVVWVG